MTNTKFFLLLGTSLSFISTLSYAQCVATQDCATLGYTETSCNGGKGVKCPFGNKWACLGANEEECMKIACEKLDFKYSCTGTGYAGGIGKSCNGKYASCNCQNGYSWNGSLCQKASCSLSYRYTCSGTGYAGGAGSACGGKYIQCACASGYEWKNGSCQQQVLNGADGDLYYCNGVVVAVKAPEMDFYVAMQNLGYMNWSDADSRCQNYSFCGNLKGTLPTLDQLQMMYKNKSSLESLLTSNGGNKFSTDNSYWSSTYFRNFYGSNYYGVNMYNGNVYLGSYDTATYYVRPVLTSW